MLCIFWLLHQLAIPYFSLSVLGCLLFKTAILKLSQLITPQCPQFSNERKTNRPNIHMWIHMSYRHDFYSLCIKREMCKLEHAFNLDAGKISRGREWACFQTILDEKSLRCATVSLYICTRGRRYEGKFWPTYNFSFKYPSLEG